MAEFLCIVCDLFGVLGFAVGCGLCVYLAASVGSGRPSEPENFDR